MSQSFPSEDVELGGPVLFVETVWRGAFDKGAIKETSQTMYMYIMDEIKQPPPPKAEGNNNAVYDGLQHSPGCEGNQLDGAEKTVPV